MRETSFSFSKQNSQEPNYRGGEKKVMKKGLSLILAIAMVFSMFASVAFAAEMTPADAGAKLKELNVILGDQKGDLMTDSTWKRQDVAVLLSRLLGEETAAKATAKNHTFADVRGTAYDGFITWAKEKGLMVGHSATKFGFDDQITKQQFAAVVLRALGKEVEYAKVGEEAVKAGLFAEGTDFTTAAKRGDTYVIIVKALNTEVKPGETLGAALKLPGFEKAAVAIASATVIGAKKIEVKFTAAADKATVVVKNSTGTVVNSKSVTLADDKKSAVVEFAANIAAGDYTVVVTGLDKELTQAVKVEAEKVAKIEFVGDKLTIDRAHANKASINYKVTNQYGEDVTTSNAVKVTNSESTGSENNTSGTITVTKSSGNFAVDAKVLLTALHVNTNTFASATATVVAASKISTVDIVKLDIKDSKVLEQGADAANFKVELELKDQYGNVINTQDFLTSYWASDVNVSVNPSSNSSVTFKALPKVTDKKVYLELQSIVAAGSNAAAKTTLTIVSLSTGSLDKIELDVKEAAKLDTLTLTAPTNAAKDSEVEISFNAVDQFGAAMKHIVAGTDIVLTANGAGNNGGSALVTSTKDVVKDVTKLKLKLSATASDTIVITGLTKTNKLVQLQFNTVAKKVPTSIAGVKDVPALLVGATKQLTVGDNVIVNDQYGNKIDLPAGYSIKIAESSDAITLSAATLSSTVTAAAKGTATVTLTVYDGTNDVANSSYSFDIKVVEKAAISSYEATVSGVVYAGGAASYHKALEVTGLLADGTKVAIPNDAANYTVVAPQHVNFEGTGKVSVASGFFSEAGKDGEATIIVTVFGASSQQVIPVTVKTSNKASAVATLEVVENGTGVKKIDTNYIAVEQDVINAGLNSVVANAVKAVDQYGTELTGGTEPTYTVRPSNYTDAGRTAALGNLNVGDTFNVTAVTGGKYVTFKVLVNANPVVE